MSDILIVGAGLAGLNAAAEIRERAPELSLRIVDAGGAASAEVMGFSVPVRAGDSPEIMEEDTLRAGGGRSDPALVRRLAENARGEMRRLEDLGLVFDRDAQGEYDVVHAVGARFGRVVHAGTSTGAQAMRRLAKDLPPVERRRVTRLLTDGGRITGVLFDDGGALAVKAVVLAGGGFAGLWKFATASKRLRGDCLWLAMDAGAPLRDIGLVQFEPTVTVFPEELAGFPVITTPLFEGARLLDRHGASLIAPDGPVPAKRELAERIHRTIRRGDGLEHGGVRYDFSGVDEASFAARYPGYHKKFSRLAPTMREPSFEVKPGAHTTLGGIRIDAACRTTVPGLFAAGEAAGGLHGRDRLGGNAGLEVFVFGRIAGAGAAAYAQTAPKPPEPSPAMVSARAAPPATPEAVYGAVAEILDACFPVIPEESGLREGLARLAAIADTPVRRLAEQVFADALNLLG